MEIRRRIWCIEQESKENQQNSLQISLGLEILFAPNRKAMFLSLTSPFLVVFELLRLNVSVDGACVSSLFGVSRRFVYSCDGVEGCEILGFSLRDEEFVAARLVDSMMF
ncbi:hypothetical protein Droror1_Dr00004323 [Drosera rotundifolia]